MCILNTRTGQLVGQRLDERFAMYSTFKLPLAAVVLREADLGRLQLTDTIEFSQKDMVPHAPVTAPHLATTKPSWPRSAGLPPRGRCPEQLRVETRRAWTEYSLSSSLASFAAYL